jgi:flagellar motility protein MotE (MotC chaperone)
MQSRNNQEEDGRLRSLVRIYESMKPKDAAQIFDKLEINVLLGVVERMKEQKVAPILASMQPDRARQVTDMLADKSQRPPPRR